MNIPDLFRACCNMPNQMPHVTTITAQCDKCDGPGPRRKGGPYFIYSMYIFQSRVKKKVSPSRPERLSPASSQAASTETRRRVTHCRPAVRFVSCAGAAASFLNHLPAFLSINQKRRTETQRPSSPWDRATQQRPSDRPNQPTAEFADQIGKDLGRGSRSSIVNRKVIRRSIYS